MVKNKTRNSIIAWVLAVLITVFAAFYQKVTGPTYPKKVKTEINNIEYELKFLRSSDDEGTTNIDIKIADENVRGVLYFKNYPENQNDGWMPYALERITDSETSFLRAKLPSQPPAGKLMYYVEFKTDSDKVFLFKESPIIIRFKGKVPNNILIPHIFFMFFAMMLSNVAGLFAAFNLSKFRLYTYITVGLMLVGGLILGPIVQKYAFNEYWAGVPYGWDLTDNKLLVAFIVWFIAFVGNLKSEKSYLTIIATIVTIIIFSIPHSMHGSELNRESGTIIQGFVTLIKPLF